MAMSVNVAFQLSMRDITAGVDGLKQLKASMKRVENIAVQHGIITKLAGNAGVIIMDMIHRVKGA